MIYSILEPMIVVAVFAIPVYLARPLVMALSQRIARSRSAEHRIEALESELEALKSLEGDRTRESEDLRTQLAFFQGMLKPVAKAEEAGRKI